MYVLRRRHPRADYPDTGWLGTVPAPPAFDAALFPAIAQLSASVRIPGARHRKPTAAPPAWPVAVPSPPPAFDPAVFAAIAQLSAAFTPRARPRPVPITEVQPAWLQVALAPAPERFIRPILTRWHMGR